jgi:hypothetical protein
MITGIPIKETEGVVCKPFQHFINEGQREMILLCSLIEFPIVSAHPPPNGETLSNQLILIVRNDRQPSLLRHYLNRTNPLTIRHGIDNVAEPIRLNYSGSSALVITIQAILTQRTSNRTTHWSVGSPPDSTTVTQDRGRFTSHEG